MSALNDFWQALYKESWRYVWVILGLAVIGGMLGSVGSGVAGALLGVLLLYLRTRRSNYDEAFSNSNDADAVELQQLVDEINEIDSRSRKAANLNQSARDLERKAKEEKEEGNNKRADELINKAKAAYLELVDDRFEGTYPYKRLAIIYRSEKDYDREVEISKMALRRAKLTERQREHFEHRIQRAKEMKKKS